MRERFARDALAGNLDLRPIVSTATAFKHHRPFPFFPSLPSGTYTFDIVDNLTLAEVMAFYWNLESASFTFAATGDVLSSGTHYYTAATGTVGIGPPQGTGNFANLDEWYYSGAIARAASGTALADLPSTTTAPRDRVCAGSLIFSADHAYTAGDPGTVRFPHTFKMEYWVKRSGTYSNRYAIEYRFIVAAGNYYSGTLYPRIAWVNPSYTSAASATLLYIDAGFFTLGGISFPWSCYGNVYYSPLSVTYTGGTMICTSSDYTY